MLGGRCRARAAILVCLLGAACRSVPEGTASSPQSVRAGGSDPLLARYALEQGRALQREGRIEAAVRVLREGVQRAPESAALRRALARALEAQGSGADAAEEWARADAIDPPPPPLPDAALPGGGAGLLVALVQAEGDPPDLAAPTWPEADSETALTDRLARRLPRARVLRADPGSVAAARQWLTAEGARAAISIALERDWCGFTVKDGHFGIAVLRVAAAAPGRAATQPHRVTAILEEPRGPADCRSEAVARALERALAGADVEDAVGAARAGDWSREALRALFPGITWRMHEALRSGRALLAAGDLAAAQSAFESAAAIDREDPDAQAYLADTALTLDLARQLAARPGSGRGAGAAEALEPRLTPERREAAERALEDERRRRDELLAALAVLDEDLAPPPAATLEALRSVEVSGSDAFGTHLARERAGGEVVARVAYAPDGSELARYYMPRAGGAPVLREEDTDGDGEPDRWIAYRDGARSEIFEAGTSRRPELHFVFADGGSRLVRVEVDRPSDGRPERIFLYDGGRLHAEEIDTDGDGRLDRFDRFDDAGRVALREEDLDGDGAIDVRSLYEGGHLVRREFNDTRLAPGS